MIATGELRPGDRARWAELWRQYLQFYRTEVPPAQYDATWARLQDDRLVHGLGARDGDRLVGIVHYLFHPTCWNEAPVCYLQDLFTDPAERGRGTARTLIAAVGEAARARGAGRLYWLTQSDNATARALYDKVARHSGFIRYEINL